MQISRLHLLDSSEGTFFSTLWRCKDQRGPWISGPTGPTSNSARLLHTAYSKGRWHLSVSGLALHILRSEHAQGKLPGCETWLMAELSLKHQPFSRESSKDPVQCGFSENGRLQIPYSILSRQKQEATRS